MAKLNVLKEEDRVIKVTLTHHYYVSNHCFGCDIDMGGWDEYDCDFWLYKSHESANRKVQELYDKYKISERMENNDEEYDYYRVRKEVCLVWD